MGRRHLQRRCPDPVGRLLLNLRINLTLGAGMIWSDLVLSIAVYMLFPKPVKSWGGFVCLVGWVE